MNHLRALEADRRTTLGRLGTLLGDHAAVVAASRDTNADDEHDPEGTTIAFERSQIDALVRQTRDHLREIEAALVRVEDGTYETCEACGGAIGAARLAARPTARRCIRCASRR